MGKRPACDCVCEGDRRQDAAGFEREINEFHTQKDSVQPLDDNKNGRNQNRNNKGHDATTNLKSMKAWDEKFNTNNFYSSHKNTKTKEPTKQQAKKGKVTQYNEKDQSYKRG